MNYKREQLTDLIEVTSAELNRYLTQNNKNKHLYSEEEVVEIQKYFEQKNRQTKKRLSLLVTIGILAFLVIIFLTLIMVNFYG